MCYIENHVLTEAAQAIDSFADPWESQVRGGNGTLLHAKGPKLGHSPGLTELRAMGLFGEAGKGVDQYHRHQSMKLPLSCG
jgi:hypothetical protein